MQQRVGIARALATKPEILLMDEPFGAVDAMTREAMQAELESIILETKQTVVFITHSIDEAIMLGDRVVVVSNRPGTIRDVVDVALPRSRFAHEDLKSHPNFQETRQHLWALLSDEALGAKGDSHEPHSHDGICWPFLDAGQRPHISKAAQTESSRSAGWHRSSRPRSPSSTWSHSSRCGSWWPALNC